MPGKSHFVAASRESAVDHETLRMRRSHEAPLQACKLRIAEMGFTLMAIVGKKARNPRDVIDALQRPSRKVIDPATTE